MHYLIIGAGGVGGSIAAKLSGAGYPVDLIARGAHLDAIRKHGLTVIEDSGACSFALPSATAEEYDGAPDVVFACVKGYALDSIIPCLRRIATPKTVVIPLLNIYGTGEKLQAQLPDTLVTDGCVYITAEIQSPGVILHRGSIFRIVFGCRDGNNPPRLAQIAKELAAGGRMQPQLSTDIRRDAFCKYAYISPVATAGLAHHAAAGDFGPGTPAERTFLALSEELRAIALASGIALPESCAADNLAICRSLDPSILTSLQRDYYAGRPSEIDGLVFEPVRLAQKLGVAAPTYAEIAARFGYAESRDR